MRYHYTMGLIKNGEIEFEHTSRPTRLIADGLIKPLGPVNLAQFVEGLGLSTVASAKAERGKLYFKGDTQFEDIQKQGSWVVARMRHVRFGRI